MSYIIKWRPEAIKELRKLPKEISQRIVKRIDIAKDEPKHFLEKLIDDSGYKIRTGDYRAIIDLLETEKTLAVRVVGHRKNIYKRHLE